MFCKRCGAVIIKNVGLDTSMTGYDDIDIGWGLSGRGQGENWQTSETRPLAVLNDDAAAEVDVIELKIDRDEG